MYLAFRKLIAVFVLLFLVLGIIGCDDESDCCTIIDVNVLIHYKNALGENLIDSSPEYDASNIRVYYKNGDEYEYAYNNNLAAPNMHRIDQDSMGNVILTVYPSYYYEDNQSTTLIELNTDVVDTLVCEFELSENREIVTSAWLNGELMEGRYLEVQK